VGKLSKTNPKDFWKQIKDIAVTDIAKEANRPISVAIVGMPELRAEATQALYAIAAPETTTPRALPASPFLQGFDDTTTDSHFPQQSGIFDFVIDVGGGRDGVPEGTSVYSVAELGGWENTLDRIVEDRPEIALALARNFPIFRRRVANKVITKTAINNAQFSLITGVAEAIPLLGAIGLPINGLADIIILTKNQIMMTLRLAAVYGLELDYKSRMKELAPILANAFGWRAVARELVGAVPGVGFLARAMISYAGTLTVGKTAQLYYETGEAVTKAQARRIYTDAYQASREKIRVLAEAIRRGRGGGGGGSKRIPASTRRQRDLSTEEPPLGLDASATTEQREAETAPE
jgi:uncharacterized protein (DUF697 family)